MVTGQYALGYKTFSVGIQEQALHQGIRCYPNPAAESVTFDLPATAVPYNLAFYAIDGRLTAMRQYTGGQLSLAGFAKGVYQVQISSPDGTLGFARLVVGVE
jgi:hypothetical protein